MVEQARRERIERASAAGPTPEWEVFVREGEPDPLRHVGSVSAGNAVEAHEHAGRLFGLDAADVWLCPADSVARFSTRGLQLAARREYGGGENAPEIGDEEDAPGAGGEDVPEVGREDAPGVTER